MRPTLLLGALVVLVIGCPGAQNALQSPPPPVGPVAAHPKEPVVVHPSKTGLGFRLSDAEPPPEEHAARPAATPLGPEDAKRLFDRLPPLKAIDDAVDFALRAKSIPAPRPGETVHEAFPPPVTGPPLAKVTAGPLRITREEPEGDVELAPYVSVTFSAPMVPITSHAELSKIPVLIKLSRYLRALAMDRRADGALSARAALPDGHGLHRDRRPGDPQRHRCRPCGRTLVQVLDPALRLREHGPTYGPTKLTPVIYARFDQAIDREALAAAMVVTQDGNPVKVRLATEDEIAANPTAAVAEVRDDQAPLSMGVGDYSGAAGGQYTGKPRAGRFLAVTPAVPLHTSAAVVVRFPAGTGSLEGPTRTKADQSFDFHTYSALKVIDHRCYQCNPFTPFDVEFNNGIDLAKFDKRLVTVTPEIAGMKVIVAGRRSR